MSLLNSLFSGVSGLRNHQTMMDVIGDNVANVNSVGYKASRVTFSDTFSQFVRYGTNPTETSGGTNSFQVGLGAKINSIDRKWTQGTFENTGVNTDLALQGSGLFILEKNGQRYFSRAGSFSFDANGNLVNPNTGALVQGKLATTEGIIPSGDNMEAIKIDPNRKIPAKATTLASWTGNLSANSALTRSENLIQSGNINTSLTGPFVDATKTIYDPNGNAYTFSSSYTKPDLSGNSTVSYDLKDSLGNSVIGGPKTAVAVFDATGKMSTFDGANVNPPTGTYDGLQITSTDASLGISFFYNPKGVTAKSGEVTTLASSVDGNRTPNVVTGTLNVFDSLGNSHTLTIKYTKTLDNNWSWQASVPSASGTLTQNSGTIVFNQDGSIASPTTNYVLSFNPANGAATQNIELNFGQGLSGITQTNSDSVVSPLNQNGTAAASLANISVDQYGKIVGVFSNGESRNLGQVMIANFTNLNGLINAGDNMYTVSANSGIANYGVPGEATHTTVQSGILEQSNVDLAEEFTKMIVSQRGYQANARMITTADNMLQEITNLVR